MSSVPGAASGEALFPVGRIDGGLSSSSARQEGADDRERRPHATLASPPPPLPPAAHHPPVTRHHHHHHHHYTTTTITRQDLLSVTSNTKIRARVPLGRYRPSLATCESHETLPWLSLQRLALVSVSRVSRSGGAPVAPSAAIANP